MTFPIDPLAPYADTLPPEPEPETQPDNGLPPVGTPDLTDCWNALWSEPGDEDLQISED
jgi:hypothetical protein